MMNSNFSGSKPVGEWTLLTMSAALAATAWTVADHLLWQRNFGGDPAHALRWQVQEWVLVFGGILSASVLLMLGLLCTERLSGMAARGARAVQLVFVPLLFVAAMAIFENGAGSALRPLMGLILLAVIALLWPTWMRVHPPRSALRAVLLVVAVIGAPMAYLARATIEEHTPLAPPAWNRALMVLVVGGVPFLIVFVRLAAARIHAAAMLVPMAMAALFLGWGFELPARDFRKNTAPNLILIYADTLRRDRVGLYDRERGQTPQIDRFFERGVVFEDPISPSCWTLPALTSVFSQRMPALRLDLRKGLHVMTLDTQTLAEALSDRGYRTAAFTANPLIFGATGLLRGYQEFVSLHHLTRREEPDRTPPLLARFFAFAMPKIAPDRRYRDRNPELVDRSLEWIDQQREESYCLWLHFMSPHDPYDPPSDLFDARGYDGQLPLDHYAPSHEGPNEVYLQRGWIALDEADKQHAERLYDAETRGLDRELGRLLVGLEERGALVNTIVVLLADHGEELWDHGGFYHGHSLYRELCEVPWMMRAPGFAATRVPGVVSTLDLVATLKDMLDVEAEPESVARDGQSVVPRMRGASMPPRAALSAEHREHLYSVRDDDWCAIWNAFSGERWLYDRRMDPHEERNVVVEQPAIFERYLPVLESIERTARERALLEQSTRSESSDSNASHIEAAIRAMGY